MKRLTLASAHAKVKASLRTKGLNATIHSIGWGAPAVTERFGTARFRVGWVVLETPNGCTFRKLFNIDTDGGWRIF